MAIAIVVTLFLQFWIIHWLSPRAHDLIFPLDLTWWKKPWTLLTSRLAHRNFAHLSNNLQGLLLIGPIIERWLGWPRFVIFTFSTAAVAGLAGLYLDAFVFVRKDDPSSVGLSSGIWAVMGFAAVGIAASWRRWVARAIQNRPFTIDDAVSFLFSHRIHELFAAAVILYQVFSLARWDSMDPHVGAVGNTAHLAGLLLGLGAGLFWLRRVGAEGTTPH